MIKKNNKTAFTLIELLAVIVILAIIALIATPIILNVISDAKKGAFQASVYGIISAAENNYTKDLLKDNTNKEVVYEYKNGIESSNIGNKLMYKGNKPISGNIIVSKTGKIRLSLHNGEWCARKDQDKDEIKLTKTSANECVTPIPMPSIEIIGNNPYKVEINTEYKEPGYKATGVEGNDITDKVIVIGSVNVEVLGEQELIYSVQEDEKYIEVKRQVKVEDTTPPIITVPNETTITMGEVSTFELLDGVNVTDNSREEIIITTSGDLSAIVGTYTITYKANDSSGNTTTVERTIIVIDDTPPTNVTIKVGASPNIMDITGEDLESGILKYVCEYGTSSGNYPNSVTVETSSTSTTCNLGTLPTGTNYVRVVVYNNAGLTTASNEITTTPDLVVPLYTGQYELVKYKENAYYMRLLTSGTLTFPTETKVDAFLVGGGGGGAGGWYNEHNGYSYGAAGGGGGRTITARNIMCGNSESISVSIGNGGSGGRSGEYGVNPNPRISPAKGNSGGSTSFKGYVASGGTGGDHSSDVYTTSGGSGGSGGGSIGGQNSSGYINGGSGGSNGGSGGKGGMGISHSGGSGQGSTTRAFEGDKLPFTSVYFAGGGGGSPSGTGGTGGGGNGSEPTNCLNYPVICRGGNGTNNTGGGGGAGHAARLGYGDGTVGAGGSGGSGIVIIRWGPGW